VTAPPGIGPRGTAGGGLQRTLARGAALGVIAVGLGGAYWLHVESGIEWERDSLRDQLLLFGAIAPLVFVFAVAFRPLLMLPSFVILAAGGILFGTFWGTLWGIAGGTLGAVLAFFVSRALGREAVERRERGRLARIDRYLGARGPIWLAAYCSFPASPLTPAFAGAGLTSMRIAPFTLASAAGLLPRTWIYSLLGDSVWELDWTRIALVVALMVGLVLVAAPARHYLFALPEVEEEPEEHSKDARPLAPSGSRRGVRARER
jgi:uncharacterized membrane protein YdjX (TVP38/TMEM64 family)